LGSQSPAKVQQLTNGSRGIANAWRLWCKIEVQCLRCVFWVRRCVVNPL